MSKRSFLHLLALLAVVWGLTAPSLANDYFAGDAVFAPPVAQVPSVEQAPLEDYCDDGPYWTYIAAVEATYLRPELLGDNNVSFENGVAFDSNDFDHDYGAAPRVWIGLENPNGWGARARYWDFTSAAAVNDIDFGGIGSASVVDGASIVNAYTIDLELTKRLCRPNWDFLGGLGVRYAEIRHNEQLHVLDAVGLGYASYSRQTHGTGLTGVLEATRPVGDRGFSLFGSLRGSVLWGDTDAANTIALSSGGSTSTGIASFEEVDETLSIVEVQGGVEWSHELACCRGLVFVRALFEYQIWTTDVDPSIFQNFGLDDVAAATANFTSDTAFYGAAFTIGIAH
ncbi:MAG: hypothetical protein L0211_06475 [Planctomycetaceae bacterium]|nr:hypothetical protein [Planctomycetaceae bacterium]